MHARTAPALMLLLAWIAWVVTSLSAFGAGDDSPACAHTNAPLVHALDTGLGPVVLAFEKVERTESEAEPEPLPPTSPPPASAGAVVVGARTDRVARLLSLAEAALASHTPAPVADVQLPRTRHDRRVQGARAPPLA